MTSTVLVVDDKDENLYYLEALLRGHGFSVAVARHGAEALTIARLNPPTLIVSDLLMPVMDGYTLLRHWKADPLLRGIPFVVYTATYTEPADEQLAIDLGADAFVLKPCEPDELMNRLRTVLDSGVIADSREISNDDQMLSAYRSTLIRKLEEKSMQLLATNQALAHTTQQQSLILDSVAEGIHGLDMDGRIVFENKAGIAILGWDEGEVVGQSAHRMLHSHRDSVAVNSCAMHQTLSDGRVRRVQDDRFLRKDGSTFPAEYIVSPTRDASGLVTGAVVVFRDSTDQRAAEQKLREQAALLDQAQDAIIVRALDHTIRFWNRSAERLYGWSAAEAIGQSARELLQIDQTAFAAETRAVMAHGEWVGELQQQSRNAVSLVVEARSTLLLNDEGTPNAILSINTDISTRKIMEQQLLRAQRMESIGTLAGGIAHDLNNVLAPIMMSIEVLKDIVVDEDGREMLDLIATSAKRGASMVAQVLSFGRGLDTRRVPVRLNTIVREVRAIIGETFPKNIEVHESFPSDLWSCEADQTQIHQVLLNLCVNARDAMPRGGELTISASNMAMDDLGAAMNIEASTGPYVTLRVIDTGTGIPESELHRIFDPFFTTKEVGKGTGLGLATAQAIVKNHGGFIRVHSVVGKGTEFALSFPALTATDTVSLPSQPAALPGGQGELILVVDDELAIRQVTRHVLEANGYRVALAVDGSDAVTEFVRHEGNVALVITDMMMPRLDGRAATAVLRSLDPGVRIIGTSGLGQADPASADARTAIRYFLNKPFDAATLLRTVRAALDE